MSFILFNQFPFNIPPNSPSDDFYSILEQMRNAVNKRSPSWATYRQFIEYAEICFWAIRKQEYNFIIDAFIKLEAKAKKPLKVLDVGCGVVPLNNWVSKKGHEVIAFDPHYADIRILVSNRINDFYESNVLYLSAQGEQLPFDSAFFDVVICTSVLEHTVPGNDRLMLWEIARVLKPGGQLLITFDVAPRAIPQEGEFPFPNNFRRFAEPYTFSSAKRLLEQVSPFFSTTPLDLPPELDSLSWSEVFSFWRASQEHDGRDDVMRHYLAMGAVIQRRNKIPSPQPDDIRVGLHEGQNALHDRLRFHQYHADRRLAMTESLNKAVISSDEIIQSHFVIMNSQQETIKSQQETLNLQQETLVSRQDALQSQDETLKAKEEVIQLQKDTLQTQDETLKSKEEVIHSQTNTIHRFRSSLGFWLQNGALNRSSFSRFILKTLIFFPQQLNPKLTRLVQYAPKPLKIPKRYYKVSHPPEDLLPSISIVTPSYNQGKYIERTVKSILEENYPKLQYVIQDGGSTDNSVDLLKKLSKEEIDFESRKDSGQANAINRGFLRTSGEIMAFINSDDILLPGSLFTVANFFHQHSKVDVVYGHRIIINEDDEEIGRWVLAPHSDKMLLWADYVPQETLFWRREIWEKAGGYIDESFEFALDWDLLLRFRDAGAKFVRLPRFLAAFRVHPAQKTSALMDVLGEKEMDQLRIRCHGRSVSFEETNLNIKPYQYHSLLYHKLYRLGLLRY